MKFIIALVVVLTVPALASADIYTLAIPTDQGMQFYWWPTLPPLTGWEHDEDASRAQSVNALVPKGTSFSSAPAIIYAKALYKPRVPNTKSLEQLISDDAAEFASAFPGVSVIELPTLADGDGHKLRYFSFTPKRAGSWERVAYSEEGEFYLIFTVSGSSKAALSHALADFEMLLSTYKARL